MKGRNEREYEMLIKMGEANEMCEKMKDQISYRAYKA
jgi:hypothetical protein